MGFRIKQGEEEVGKSTHEPAVRRGESPKDTVDALSKTRLSRKWHIVSLAYAQPQHPAWVCWTHLYSCQSLFLTVERLIQAHPLRGCENQTGHTNLPDP